MEAEDQYKLGMELKQKGQLDAALTAFRRAALADPTHDKSLMQIGLLCRDKAKNDPMFLRYAFDAFQKVARRNLSDEEAHNQYIMMSQQMKRMDELQAEYNEWARTNPTNEFIQKCNKNILTISMAMIPQNIDVGGASFLGLRKVFLVTGILLIVSGLACMLVPLIMVKTGSLDKSKVAPLVRVGIGFGVMGGLAFVVRARIN